MTINLPSVNIHDDRDNAFCILGNNPHVDLVTFYVWDAQCHAKNETHHFRQADKDKALDELMELWTSEYVPY